MIGKVKLFELSCNCRSHTTTSQLKHDSNVIKQKTSVQSTGKVEAQTDTSSKYTSGWTSSVLYHLY